jgi:CDP-paratose 2-epimerase
VSVLITGGAGFVGASLARRLKERYPNRRVVAVDNLKRRGSELNLSDFKRRGIEFIHGDIRNPDDLAAVEGCFDRLIEASAEASVLAGLNSDPSYLLHTNLTGTLNCLQFARARCDAVIFLSSSRVYSIPALRALPLAEGDNRLDLDGGATLPVGCSARGISETFETARYRSLYGATKLAAELIIQEYGELFGLRAVVNRCGVIAGSGQWGKADQGVYTMWVARHHFEKELRYIGFGGTGKQVRDLLHPSDLFALIDLQSEQMREYAGEVYNVGGGLQGSISLRQYTELCREVTGKELEIGTEVETTKVDVPYYVTDNTKVTASTGWSPKMGVKEIVTDIFEWLKAEENTVRPLFG